MNISKAQWSTEGNSVKLSMPIAKVDQERRTVSGFATLDNIDRQGDIVPSDASLKAFGKFRGNLREMHQQIAVGKVVSFKEDKYFDPETKKFYNGVYVSAYVSKGAQDTWEKVLDGTLTGFSIGGNILDDEDTYIEELGKSVRIIKDYELYELSLVDNPANQYANVISIQKNHDGGYLSKTSTENVFWCSKDDLVQISANASSDCPRCDKGMQNIGFVETNDADKAEVVKSILSRIKNEVKEVSKMAEENIEVDETVEAVEAEAVVEETEKAVDAPVVEEDAAVEKADEEANAEEVVEEVEKAVEVAEEAAIADETVQEDPAVDVAKTITETVTSTLETLADTVKALNAKIEDLHKTVTGITDEISNMSKEISGVNQEVKEVKGNFDEFGKRVDAVEKDTAFRKSGDLGEVVQDEPMRVQKSLWGGRFLNKSDLFA